MGTTMKKTVYQKLEPLRIADIPDHVWSEAARNVLQQIRALATKAAQRAD
jgi:hypothetical protein